MDKSRNLMHPCKHKLVNILGCIMKRDIQRENKAEHRAQVRSCDTTRDNI